MGLIWLAGPFDYLMSQGGGALLEARRIPNSKKHFFCFINATNTSPMAISVTIIFPRSGRAGPGTWEHNSHVPGPSGPAAQMLWCSWATEKQKYEKIGQEAVQDSPEQILLSQINEKTMGINQNVWESYYFQGLTQFLHKIRI